MKPSVWPLLALVLICSACERPFVEVSEPGIEVVSPDLSEVQLESVIALRVRAESFRPVGSVFVNGVAMQPSQQGSEFWELLIALNHGLNLLVLEASDVDDVTATDTAFAAYVPYTISPVAPHLPQPRGGHAVARMRGGGLMVSGGAARAGGEATTDVFVLEGGRGTFTASTARLLTRRAGHTATVLPGNRILIVGGSLVDNPTSVSQLVESVELFEADDASGSFRELHMEGQPIRRTEHTAVLRNTGEELLLDLVGGRGDTRYGNDPFLGTRQDIRRFRLEGDTLVATDQLLTAYYLDEPISGHTETQGLVGPYFVLGNRFVDGQAIHASVRLNYPGGTGLSHSPAPAFHTPRTRHAAAAVPGNLLVVFGGHQGEPSEIVTEMEILSDFADRFFAMPRSVVLLERYSHTATSMSMREILIIGGFGRDGIARAASEFFVLSAEDQTP